MYCNLRNGSAAATALSLMTLAIAALPVTSVNAQIAAPTASRWEKEREHTLVTQVDLKAAIMFSKGKEDLLLSPRYRGAEIGDFAYVVPVPSRPTVTILKGSVFHELAKLSFPEESSDGLNATLGSDRAKPGVSILEHKVVGAYDVTVLSSSDSKALSSWLKTNNYRLPPSADDAIGAYVKRGWTFVACKIKDPDSSHGLRTGELAPLHLHFTASQPTLPMRLGAANPAPFSLVCYVMMPKEEARHTPGGMDGLKIVSAPGERGGESTPGKATSDSESSDTPTLSQLSHDKSVRIYVERVTIKPDDCSADYVWTAGDNSRSDE